MGYNPNFHHRRSIRLHGYDYSQPGAYYVTICTAGRECLFGQVVEKKVELSSAGMLVRREWVRLPEHYRRVALDSFVVMPNHVHGIVWLTEHYALQALSEVIRGFKTWTSRRINERRKSKRRLWQRNYYEHVVRDEEDLTRIRQYILDNPAKWDEDSDNPSHWRSAGADFVQNRVSCRLETTSKDERRPG